MKATTLVKNDHAAVKKLFADFSRTTARAPRRRQELIDKIAQELEIHSTLEEELFYPAVKNVRGGQSLVNEAESEHKKVDALLAEAQGMNMETDEVMQKVKELRDAVVHHATEEEGEMFPVAEHGLGLTIFRADPFQRFSRIWRQKMLWRVPYALCHAPNQARTPI